MGSLGWFYEKMEFVGENLVYLSEEITVNVGLGDYEVDTCLGREFRKGIALSKGHQPMYFSLKRYKRSPYSHNFLLQFFGLCISLVHCIFLTCAVDACTSL